MARVLASGEPEERRRAVARIAELPPAARVSPLLSALGDTDWRVRKEAISVAAELGPEPDLLSALADVFSPGDNVGLRNATVEALARAREGDGPTFIEAVTYRAAPHATADDPSAYWDESRVEAERRNECLGRYERYLRRLGVLTDEAAEETRADALERMKRGIESVEALPPPDPELVFAHAYADPPGSLRDG